jgi:hypothetical protein
MFCSTPESFEELLLQLHAAAQIDVIHGLAAGAAVG